MTVGSHQVEFSLVAEERKQKFQVVADPLNLLWRVWVWLCDTLASGLVELGLGLLGQKVNVGFQLGSIERLQVKDVLENALQN